MSVHVHMFKSKIIELESPTRTWTTKVASRISGDLMDAAKILEHEQVHIWNVTQGTRLVTYALRGDDDSGVICINGAAAHRAKPGDKVIISTFAEVPEDKVADWKPTVVLVDEKNRVADLEYAETAGPKRI